MNRSEAYNQKLELKKLGIQQYWLSFENNYFDLHSDRLIEELESKMVLLNSNSSSNIEILFLEKELFAIAEMKIIYAYKHFESHLKFLINASYPDSNENKFYRWSYVEDFFKTKKINLKNVENYKELIELRNLNNSIKHSRNIINNETKLISEFRKKSNLHYTDILKFYNRTQKCSSIFLKSLTTLINNDLYEFDEKRIEEISDEFISRMDFKAVNVLIEKLQQKNK